ncbi:hypothetical protein ACWEVP_44125 [Amycolatopsis sp. NPDC003865]
MAAADRRGAYTRCGSRLPVDYDRYGPWVRVGKTSTAVQVH